MRSVPGPHGHLTGSADSMLEGKTKLIKSILGVVPTTDCVTLKFRER